MFNNTLWSSIAVTLGVFLIIFALYALIGGTGFWPAVYIVPIIGAYVYWLSRKVRGI